MGQRVMVCLQSFLHCKCLELSFLSASSLKKLISEIHEEYKADYIRKNACNNIRTDMQRHFLSAILFDPLFCFNTSEFLQQKFSIFITRF